MADYRRPVVATRPGASIRVRKPTSCAHDSETRIWRRGGRGLVRICSFAVWAETCPRHPSQVAGLASRSAFVPDLGRPRVGHCGRQLSLGPDTAVLSVAKDRLVGSHRARLLFLHRTGSVINDGPARFPAPTSRPRQVRWQRWAKSWPLSWPILSPGGRFVAVRSG